jgi:hypothetical protein
MWGYARGSRLTAILIFAIPVGGVIELGGLGSAVWVMGLVRWVGFFFAVILQLVVVAAATRDRARAAQRGHSGSPDRIATCR